MLAVRLIGLATALALAVMVVLWLITGERRWLERAWLVLRIALLAIVAVLLLFLGEALLRG